MRPPPPNNGMQRTRNTAALLSNMFWCAPLMPGLGASFCSYEINVNEESISKGAFNPSTGEFPSNYRAYYLGSRVIARELARRGGGVLNLRHALDAAGLGDGQA